MNRRALCMAPPFALVFLAAACADGSELTGPGALAGSHLPIACDHDDVAPVISSISASPNVLWPPNHKMVPVTVSVAAIDDCTQSVTSWIGNVTSNEPVNGLGDGNTSPDWVITGPFTVNLRAERAGPGSGRVYTLHIVSTDAAGNAALGTTTVIVPHDQGKGKNKP